MEARRGVAICGKSMLRGDCWLLSSESVHCLLIQRWMSPQPPFFQSKEIEVQPQVMKEVKREN